MCVQSLKTFSEVRNDELLGYMLHLVLLSSFIGTYFLEIIAFTRYIYKSTD